MSINLGNGNDDFTDDVIDDICLRAQPRHPASDFPLKMSCSDLIFLDWAIIICGNMPNYISGYFRPNIAGVKTSLDSRSTRERIGHCV